MARQLCQHCGLPTGSLGYSTSDSHVFCCYGCFLAWRIVGEQDQAGHSAFILARLGVAAFLSMNVMMISVLLYSESLTDIGSTAREVFRWLLLGLSIPVLLILGTPFILDAIREVKHRLPSINSLVTLGAFAGFGVSAVHVITGKGDIYFDTATMVLVLVTFGRLLEAHVKHSALHSIRGLLDLRPPCARLRRDDIDYEVPVESVSVGDTIIIRPGERIPVDGRITDGTTTVQESAFTGEFTPRQCGKGDMVYGGSVNSDGEVALIATGVGEGTLLAEIGRLVEVAQAKRAPIERLTERVATVFVPIVFAFAVGAWIWGSAHGDTVRGWLSALAVLVVACPCALGLATPLAVAVAIGTAARQGVLIRSGEVLERLSQVTDVLFDKTGTLTCGRPEVCDIESIFQPSQQFTESILGIDKSDTQIEMLGQTTTVSGSDNVLAWLASLETASEHPFAKAIVAEAQHRGIKPSRVENFRAFPGEGAMGTVSLDGACRTVIAGTQSFVERQTQEQIHDTDANRSCIYIALDTQILGRIRLTDAVRIDASQTVALLHKDGLQIGMVSGDRFSTAKKLAVEVGIHDVQAECLPEDKINEVRRRRQANRIVAVVGDGINDAPALAEADVGIAMGGGTDLAREAGHVALLGDDLTRIPWLLTHARHTYRVIRQNLAWAFGYNFIAMLVAFFGYLHPLLAASLMLVSSLFVVRNSLRLTRNMSTD